MGSPSLTRCRSVAKAVVLAVVVSAGAAAEPLQVDSAPVRLNPVDHGQVVVGGLEYRGGLALTSNDNRFGGLSGLEVSADGSHALALSDRGRWVEFGLVYDGHGRLTGVSDGSITSLHGIGGQPLADNGKDSEDLVRLSDGRLAVSFERLHRVVLYSAAAPAPGPAQRLNPPHKLAWAPGNGGIEGLAELRPGHLLALTEALLVGGDRVMGWLLATAAGTDDELFFATTRDFKPTSLATMPNGDVMVLERSYSVLAGPAARLSLVDAKTIVPGALLTGREIARISPPMTVDNFEGLALRRDANGRLLVYIISDDNFNPLQRTLLLMFRMAE